MMAPTVTDNNNLVIVSLCSQIAEIGVTEHIEGDQCKFALWTGSVPTMSETKIILRVSCLPISTVLFLFIYEIVSRNWLTWLKWKVSSDWCFVCGMNKVIFRLVFCLWDDQSHLHNFVNRGMFACHCLQDFFTRALVMTTIIEWYEIKCHDLFNLRW